MSDVEGLYPGTAFPAAYVAGLERELDESLGEVGTTWAAVRAEMEQREARACRRAALEAPGREDLFEPWSESPVRYVAFLEESCRFARAKAAGPRRSPAPGPWVSVSYPVDPWTVDHQTWRLWDLIRGVWSLVDPHRRVDVWGLATGTSGSPVNPDWLLGVNVGCPALGWAPHPVVVAAVSRAARIESLTGEPVDGGVGFSTLLWRNAPAAWEVLEPLMDERAFLVVAVVVAVEMLGPLTDMLSGWLDAFRAGVLSDRLSTSVAADGGQL